MSDCTHDCSSCGQSCSERDLRAPANAQSSIKHVIAVVSGKGGVGKSTVTACLASAMAKRGRKTAILDADITGPSIPTAFNIHERATGTDDGIDPAVTPGGLKLMSLNLLTNCETDRWSGGDPSLPEWSPSSGPTWCGAMWTICLWTCLPARGMCR